MKMNKNSVIKMIYILATVVLVALFVLPIFFANRDNSVVLSDRNWHIPIYYGVCLVSSLVCLLVYFFFYKKINIWAVLSFISASISITGYLGLSLSDDISKALLSNRIGYLGNVFLLPFNFMTIANICKIRVRIGFSRIMFCFAFVMLIFVLSQGYFDIFYKNPSLEMVNGIVSIKKEYGSMHTVYIVYIGLMFILIFALFIYALIKKKVSSKINTILIFLTVLINIFLWIIERFLPKTVEFLAVSYVATEIILLIVYKRLEKIGAFDYCNITYTIQNDDELKQQMSIKVVDVHLDTMSVNEESEKYLLISDEELKIKLEVFCSKYNLTNREIDVVYLTIKGLSRKQIAEKLIIGEETVKTHIKHIFQKLGVSSQKELKQKTAESFDRIH